MAPSYMAVRRRLRWITFSAVIFLIPAQIFEIAIRDNLIEWFRWFPDQYSADRVKYGNTVLLAIALVTYAGFTVFSWIWLRFCRRGPMEWIYRRLSYGKLN